jgi:hypothetical protein
LGVLRVKEVVILSEHKAMMILGVAGGFLAIVIAGIVEEVGTEVTLIAAGALYLAGAELFIWGWLSYARRKGKHGAWGLLGLLSILGILILALLPDKHKQTDAPEIR